MNLILDTHILLWWLEDNNSLNTKEHEAIKDANNVIVINAATIWEARIKQALGKLDLPPDFMQVIDQQGF